MITSSTNSKLTTVRKLLSHSKYRKQDKKFVLETMTVIRETAQRYAPLVDYILYETLSDKDRDFFLSLDCQLIQVEKGLLSKIGAIKSHPGIIAVVSQKPIDIEACLAASNVTVFIDGIKNPVNMGAVIRSCAAFSVDMVAISPGSVDPYHPDCIRGMAGSFFEVPFGFCDFSFVKKHCLDRFYYVLDANGEQQMPNVCFEGPMVVVVGAEMGVSCVDEDSFSMTSFKIPMAKGVDSLNVAVSTGIVLHHIAHQVTI